MLDVIDQRLVEELQGNGRQSNVEIAKKLSVAESTVRKRMKRLFNENIIRIEALPNPYKLGYGFISFMALQVRMADLREVGEKLAQKPNIYYLAFVTGRYDLVAIVMSRTPEELSNFIKEHISIIPSIIRTETFVNLEIIKSPWLGTSIITEFFKNVDFTCPQ
jgi:Lrp/AsnC family transcriptional regulator for asnA, asnC and gidA